MKKLLLTLGILILGFLLFKMIKTFLFILTITFVLVAAYYLTSFLFMNNDDR